MTCRVEFKGIDPMFNVVLKDRGIQRVSVVITEGKGDVLLQGQLIEEAPTLAEEQGGAELVVAG